MRRVVRLWLLAVLASMPIVAAQAATDDHPDLTGVYTFLPGGYPKDPVSPDPDLAKLKPINRNYGAAAYAHLQPWAKLEMQASGAYSAIDDLGAVCGPAGLFRHPTGGAGYMVLERPGWIILVSTDLSQVGVRRIHLVDHHAPNLPLTWNGDSIGHWEGDTLVVDTIGFNDKSWLGSELQPHTEALHLVERIRLVARGKALEIRSMIDDYKALTGPYILLRNYQRTDKPFEAVRSHCNANLGEQATWDYQRRQALQQLEKNRAAQHP